MPKGKLGGARPNSGPKKGTKYRPRASTLSKEAAREALRVIVTREMEALTAAQIANAKGIRYLMSRDKKGGRFRRLEKLPKPGELVGGEDEIIEVWHKDPSIQAFTDLMNRALDKPKEQMQEIEVHGLEGLAERLARGRERAGE
jgi:hypothetical protein